MPLFEKLGAYAQERRLGPRESVLGGPDPAEDRRGVLLPEVVQGEIHHSSFADAPDPSRLRAAVGAVHTCGVDLDLVFLGTSGSMPTAFRGAPSLLVRRGGERLLFDCGEGTQRQLLASAIGLVDLREIFFTHYHADHYLGLPGMLKTFALRGREEPMTVYGPTGLTSLFSDLRRIFGKLTYDYTLVELSPGDHLPRDGYVLEVFPVLHGRAAVGYTVLEHDRPGRFDVSTADTLGVPAGPERG